jgi:hypothetical protein
MKLKPPAPNPCGSCPYRRDVPSGIWAEEEYDKLPAYDNETMFQPPAVFLCHQQNGRLCAGWAGCHDMEKSLGLRFEISLNKVTKKTLEVIRTYKTSVPLFSSGAEAAEHGKRDIFNPGEKACQMVVKLWEKRNR